MFDEHFPVVNPTGAGGQQPFAYLGRRWLRAAVPIFPVSSTLGACHGLDLS